jgi:hypothetical protein
VTSLDVFLPAFTRELLSISFPKTAAVSLAQAADKTSPKTNWAGVERATKKGPLTESQLKRYALAPEDKKHADTMSTFWAGKEVAKVKSTSSRKKYSIRRMSDGRLGCSCPDWRYKRALGGGSCKHIEGLGQTKTANLAMLANHAAVMSMSSEHAKKKWRQGSAAAQGERAIVQQERERLRPQF